jgi:hypothetical protein
VNDALVMRVARRLTERDRAVLRLLYDHRVLTTDQLASVFFDSVNTAQHRLTVLHGLRLVDRFRRLRANHASAPHHYVLDTVGAMVVAAERDEDVSAFRWKPERGLALGQSQRLGHLVGINEFFCALAAAARRSPATQLDIWWSEPQCHRWVGEFVRPDGFGRWSEDGIVVEFFLEYDRGTETLDRVQKKLVGYEQAETATGETPWILFWCESPRREANVRAALSGASVPTATASAGGDRGPHAAVWAPVRRPDDRLRLIDLAGVPVPREASARAAEDYPRRWVYQRPDSEAVPA